MTKQEQIKQLEEKIDLLTQQVMLMQQTINLVLSVVNQRPQYIGAPIPCMPRDPYAPPFVVTC